MTKEKQIIKDLRNGVADIILTSVVHPQDLEWLYHEFERTKMYLDALKLYWQDLGEGFFSSFVSVMEKRSCLHSLINKQLLPERKNESLDDEIEMFLIGAFKPEPYFNDEAKQFRAILKNTLIDLWGVIVSEIFRVNQIYFLNGPMASCTPLNPGCDPLLHNLTFTHELLKEGDVEKSVTHEIAHVILEPTQIEDTEELALGVERYLMKFVKGGENA